MAQMSPCGGPKLLQEWIPDGPLREVSLTGSQGKSGCPLPPARDNRLCRVSGPSERPPQVDERHSAAGITAVTRDRERATARHVTTGGVTKERRLLCDDPHGGAETNGPRQTGYGRGDNVETIQLSSHLGNRRRL